MGWFVFVFFLIFYLWNSSVAKGEIVSLSLPLFWVVKVGFKLVTPAWCSAKLSMKVSSLGCPSPLPSCFAPYSLPGSSLPRWAHCAHVILHPDPQPEGPEGSPCWRKPDKLVYSGATHCMGGRLLYQQFYDHINREDKLSKFFIYFGLGCLISWDFRNTFSVWRLYTPMFRDPSS